MGLLTPKTPGTTLKGIPRLDTLFSMTRSPSHVIRLAYDVFPCKVKIFICGLAKLPYDVPQGKTSFLLQRTL